MLNRKSPKFFLLIFAFIIEVVGISVVGTGLTYEIILGGHIHFITMSFGSLIVAIGAIIVAKVLPLVKT